MTGDDSRWDPQQIQSRASFLQSMKWAQFQGSIGAKPHLLRGNGWSCLALEKSNRFGRYLFSPYGPNLDDAKYLATGLKQLLAQARELGVDWVKLEPVSVRGQADQIADILRAHGGRRAAHDAEPALTRVVDLVPPVETLLAGISQSTRSLIRKNQRENILTFKTSIEPADMSAFADMLDTVADRKGIGFFSKDYFIGQAEVLMPAKMMYLEQAYSGKKLVGAAVIHNYGEMSSYTYAAALPEARRLSVSALLLWQSMINAKSRGAKKLDLYGIAPEDAPPSHPWSGFSAYKKKFGGEVVELAGTWDIPITRKYHLYRAAQSLHLAIKRR